MRIRYRENTKVNERNSLLNSNRQRTKLLLKPINKPLQLKLDIKMILKVYIDEENNKKHVEATAAYAL